MLQMEDIKSYTLKELEDLLREKAYPKFYAHQIFNWIYKKRVESFDLMTNLSKGAREFLKNNFYFSHLKLIERETSEDGTEKFLFELDDGHRVETVLIPEGKRVTLCVSTQVGCKFKCRFCVSGISGFKRNLRTSEIISQYLEVAKRIGRITNIVFMGIGEPLDNFDNVVKSIEILKEPHGIYFGRRRICISTLGIIPKIEKLRELNLGVKLSISLHSPDSKVRTFLMPATKKYPLQELMKAVKAFAKYERYPITFEYIMIRNLNTKKEDALKLVKLVKGINCKINLIPYNPSPYFEWEAPSIQEIEVFKNILKKCKIFFTLRKPRGEDIKAACGQLKATFKD